MGYRLRGRLGDEQLELEVGDGARLLGAAAGCDLRIEHPTVSRRHARLTPRRDGLHVDDLGSTNGTFVGDERIDERVVGHGALVRFGKVVLRVESSDRGPADDAVPPAGGVTQGPAAVGPTGRPNPFERFVAGTLGEALDGVASGADHRRLAELVGRGLAACLPLSAVEIGWTTPGADATLFSDRPAGLEFSSQQITRTRGELYVYCAFKTVPAAPALEALLDAALAVIALGARRGPAAG